MIRSHEDPTLISAERLSYNENTHFVKEIQGAWALLAEGGEPAGCDMRRVLPTGKVSGGVAQVDWAEFDLIVPVNQITQVCGRWANLNLGTSNRNPSGVHARVVSGLFAADYADLNNWSPAGNGPATFRVIRGQNLGLTTCSCTPRAAPPGRSDGPPCRK